MCIAILNKGKIVSKSNFENSLESNPDGFGMAWIENNQIHTFKSLSTKSEELYQVYKDAFLRTDKAMFLHFRITTSGGSNLFNTHPFYINNNLVFMHNGIIPKLGTSTLSDTQEFNNNYLKKIGGRQIFNNDAIRELIAERIGHSKLVFLKSDGSHTIINPHLGIFEKDGNWYSNNSFETCRYSFDYDKWANYKPKAKVKTGSTLYQKCNSCLQIANNVEWDNVVQSNICLDCKQFYQGRIDY